MTPAPANDGALFPAGPYRVIPEPVPDRTDGQRRRDRQALRIANGLHPLSNPRHEDPATPHRPPRRLQGRHPRLPPVPLMRLPGPHRRPHPQLPEVPGGRLHRPVRRAAREPRADTDVRAWWPACLNFQLTPRRPEKT